MNIACVYHSIDLDGWMSAAIIKHWFKETIEEDNISDIGYGSFIPRDYSFLDINMEYA